MPRRRSKQMDNYVGLMAGGIGYSAAPMILTGIGGASVPPAVGQAVSIGAVSMPIAAAGGLMNQLGAFGRMSEPRRRRRK